MNEEEIKKEIKKIKDAIEVLADVLENIRTCGPIGTKDKVHDILYHND